MNRCVLRISLSLVCLPALAASDPSRIEGLRLKPKEFGQVAVSNPSLMVSKTARVDGQDVCGVIRITNSGFGPVTVSGIADSLEVHFYNNVPPPGLSVGSTPNWFKVADVPIALPGPIAPRTTATIPYCFSICQAGDYPGANSMRNVVTVIVVNPPGLPRSFGARSNSFAPPFLDCQACCLSDGSCTDIVPERCTAANGLPQGASTDCSATECPQACCLPDDSCSDDPPSICLAASGEAQGPGTDCDSTQCCAPMSVPNSCDNTGDCCTETAKCLNGECCILSEESGCILDSDCCTEGQVCEAETCCAPMRVPNTCDNTGDCCRETAKCLNGECCILTGASGCDLDSECCTEGHVCEAGTCCAPMSVPDTCEETGDCCRETAKCLNGECCILTGDSGCDLDSECCTEGHVCEAGTCCAPMRVPDTCDETADCCTETAKCLNGECCILTGDSGCNLDSDCCTQGQTCVAGACCRGFLGSCFVDTDCCSGLVCTGGLCDQLIGP